MKSLRLGFTVSALLCGLLLGHSPAASAYSHGDSLVRWHDYSKDAFVKAEKEGKPVFMLITAVWCYWCHVYEEKSLETKQVSSYLNEHYVPVFVDYDERKDIARKYPATGLPTTVIFAPDGEELISLPGYIPVDKLMTGLRNTVDYVKNEYRPRGEEQEVREAAKMVVPGKAALERYVKDFLKLVTSYYDSAYGGIGTRQKYPNAAEFLRLLEYYEESGEKKWLDMVTNTVDHMAGFSQKRPESRRPAFEELVKLRARERSDIDAVARLQTDDVFVGIYDAVEGGFFRYATRRDWTIPHYEKILSDNAELALLFLNAYRVTDRQRYRSVAEKTLHYVLTTLYDEEAGRFYGSQDADEVYYHFTAAERARVEPPHVDRNSYAFSNAQMASTLLRAAAVLGDERYAEAGRRALEFIRKELLTDYGVLSYYDHKDGRAHINGNIEPNAWAALAFLEAYGLTGEKSYLESAGKVLDFALEHLYDGESGGFFERRSTDDAYYRPGELFVDEKPLEENGVMAYALYLAYEATGDEDYLLRARQTLGVFVGSIREYSPYLHRLSARLLARAGE
ncbi:MAG TPA: thioredoxin domain-containing protein [Deltaproteobacteria bacterium]|nr:thioredoxin domain-containing protein [Deltaproteobacteria bacterium]